MSGPTLAAFRIPGFPAVWMAGTASAFGWAASTVAIAWLSDGVSTFAVGATFAARLLPALLIGIPLGSLIDRYDRRSTLIVINILGALALGSVGVLATVGHLGLAELLLLSVGLGIIDTARGTTFQSYAFDLAGPSGATNAIALSNLGGHVAGVIGSVSGGVVLDRFGPSSAFLVASGLALVAALGLAFTGRRTGRIAAAPRLVPSFTRSMTLIGRNHAVALVAFVVIVNEILGFASLTLVPTFTANVLHSDASGLGFLSSIRSLGSIAGLLLLARIGFRQRGGWLLITATLVSAVSLFAFSFSTSFAVSALLMLAVGMSWGTLDTLGQSLMQHAVDDSERGAAMGIWFFAIGFGPFGHLALGAAGNVFDPQVVLAIDSAVLALIAVALIAVRPVRRLT